MDLRDAQKPRGWLWRTKKNSFGEGGISPPTVKLFDEQEVARILEDQFRIQKEELDCTLREIDEKYGEKEKTTNEKLNKALAEITVKDNLVKQHIKVAEEAVIGWERAENEAAEFKLQLECALQQRLASEDRVEHLDGALEEAMKQLRSAREEQDQLVHETIVKKTQEYDKLRLEMESKLAEVWHIVGQTRAELIESRAENKALTHALQDRSKILAEGKDNMAGSETDMKALQVQLEGVVKENMALKYDIHVITKELEVRMTELELERKASDMASKQHAEVVKKIAKLDEECDRLRMLLRKKLLNSTALVRVKQDVGGSGKDHPSKGSPRRRPLGRSQSATDPQEAIAQETLQAILDANASVDKILNLEKETRMLKEALAKRNDELQNARFMCAKTASRLSFMEEEVQTLRAPSKPASSKKWPSNDSFPRRGTSLNFELMDDFEEMERLANSQSQSLSASSPERSVETALTVFGAVDESTNQLRIVCLEETVALRDRELEAANQMCQELGEKLSVAEGQLAFLQSRNTANEQLVIGLQAKLDSLLERRANSEGGTAVSGNGEIAMALRKLVHIIEALAQATEIESTPITSRHHDATNASETSILLSVRWHDEMVDSSMRSLLRATNGYLESGGDILKLLLELTATLDCILTFHISANEKEQRERDSSASERLAITMELESARVMISQLEEELCRLRVEHSDMEPRIQEEVGHNLDVDVMQLRTEKNELESNLSGMNEQLVEANAKVAALRVRLSESEALVKELQALQAAHDNEDNKEGDLSEQDMLERSSTGLCLSASPRDANAEKHQLCDKVASLEIELQREQCRHQEVVAKLKDIQEQTQRG
ncbi:uncharacterized protein [Physcomitrium patens]|nr:filament-like plant protein 4 isoform X2 [Physcomitrium patens]|eukprot:XP_024361757.1 filament-like plant protein 4 isoform X2 [Physcomitrella patens]